MSEILAFLAGFFTAVFAEPLRRFLFRPRLVVEFGETSDFVTYTPELHGIPGRTPKEGKAVYIRGRVVNRSTNIARQCRVYLVNIESKSENTGDFERTAFCDSIPLRWSCREAEGVFRPLDLPKEVNQYFDIVVRREGESALSPQMMTTPFRYAQLFSNPGTYRYTIQVSGEGFTPVVLRLVLEWRRDWKDFRASKEEA